MKTTFHFDPAADQLTGPPGSLTIAPDDAFKQGGVPALQPKKTGPKANYRRTEEVVRQILRQLFLDPDASAEVVAQKLRQTR